MRRRGVAATLFALLLPALACDHLAAEDNPLIHIAEGMWSEHWRLPEILAAKYQVSESFLTSRYGFATALKDFPEKKEDFLKNKVLVMANISADAFARAGSFRGMRDVKGRSVDWVEEFVTNGGGLLVLSGNYSLGIGDKIKATPLEKVLPAEIQEKDIDLEKQNKPFVFESAAKHQILDGVTFDEKPMTLFFHEVKPKAAATVVIKAGDTPILIAGTYGKGRVILLTATLHGDLQPPNVPYWKWKSWDRLMLNCVDWLAGK